MKKLIGLLLTCFILHVASESFGCQLCSCGAGGSYMGILPQFQQNLAGVRWSWQSFNSSHIPIRRETPDFALSEENFHRLEVINRYFPHKRFQLMSVLPLVVNSQEGFGSFTRVSGLGDWFVSGSWMAVNTGDSLFHKWKHTLLIGGGLKIPTGFPNDDKTHINLRPGSGS